MTKNLKWRFSKMPTPDEVLKLVNDKIITKEEAREILFNEEEQTERTKESLEQEIKFLRELVDKLSNRTQTIEVIKEIHKPYYKWDWYRPYNVWTSGSGVTTLCGSNTTTTSGTTCLTSGSGGSVSNQATGVNCSFTDIKTF